MMSNSLRNLTFKITFIGRKSRNFSSLCFKNFDLRHLFVLLIFSKLFKFFNFVNRMFLVHTPSNFYPFFFHLNSRTVKSNHFRKKKISRTNSCPISLISLKKFLITIRKTFNLILNY